MNTWPESSTKRTREARQVVVVGGGPAGSAAATAAARLGMNVLVVESGPKYRDKACGDMFVPAAAALLRRLGLDCQVLQSVRRARSFGAVELRATRGLLWKVLYPDEPVWI